MPLRFDIASGKFVEIDEKKDDKLVVEMSKAAATLIKGDKGDDGKDGINGKDGKDGAPGRDGKDGKDGINGKDGVDGLDGVPGLNGLPGKDGREIEMGASKTHFQWRYVGDEWVDLEPLPKNIVGVSGGGGHSLKHLREVSVSGAQDGDVLSYNATTKKWGPNSYLSLLT